MLLKKVLATALPIVSKSYLNNSKATYVNDSESYVIDDGTNEDDGNEDPIDCAVCQSTTQHFCTICQKKVCVIFCSEQDPKLMIQDVPFKSLNVIYVKTNLTKRKF